MTREQAIELAVRMYNSKPDRLNQYAPRTAQTKARGAYVQWQQDCRALAYAICVTWRVLDESAWYTICENGS